MKVNETTSPKEGYIELIKDKLAEATEERVIYFYHLITNIIERDKEESK